MARRKKGEGSIYVDKQGRTVLRVQINNRPKAFYGKSDTDVERQYKKWKKERARLEKLGDPDKVSKMPFSEYFYGWMTSFKIYDVKPNTYDAIEYCYNCRIKPSSLSNIPLNQLKDNHFNEYIQWLIKEKNYSYATVQKTYNTINNCLEWGKAKGDILINPLDFVSIPKDEFEEEQTEKDIVFFEDDDIEKINKEATKVFSNGKEYYYYGWHIIFLMYTGLGTQ